MWYKFQRASYRDMSVAILSVKMVFWGAMLLFSVYCKEICECYILLEERNCRRCLNRLLDELKLEGSTSCPPLWLLDDGDFQRPIMIQMFMPNNQWHCYCFQMTDWHDDHVDPTDHKILKRGRYPVMQCSYWIAQIWSVILMLVLLYLNCVAQTCASHW